VGQRAAALASALGIEMSSHIFPEVSAHLLAATPTCHWLEYVDCRADPGGAAAHRRWLCASAGQARSGVAWDNDAVKRFRIT